MAKAGDTPELLWGGKYVWQRGDIPEQKFRENVLRSKLVQNGDITFEQALSGRVFHSWMYARLMGRRSGERPTWTYTLAARRTPRSFLATVMELEDL